MALTSVAVYERTIRASLERVWENVLDWEHLPWLHRRTFGHIRLLETYRENESKNLIRGAEKVLDSGKLLFQGRTAWESLEEQACGPGAPQ